MTGSPRSVGIRLVLLTLLSGVGLVASATAATVYVAGDALRRLSAAAPGGTASGALGVGSAFTAATHASTPMAALVDSLIEPLLDPLHVVAEDSAVRAKFALLVTSPQQRAVFAVQTTGTSASDSALSIFQAWARTTRAPALWEYRRGLPQVADIRTLPALRAPTIDSLFRANEAAADSALVYGDTATALRRARENIAAAGQLLWQPLPYDAVIGRARLQDAAALLARTARQADDPHLHSAAQRLQRLAQAARPAFPTPWSRHSPRAADPQDPRLSQMASDRAAFPASRVAALDQLILGGCVSTREMLFGVSPARHAAIDRLTLAMRDIARIDELRPLYHRVLDAFDDAEPAAAPTSQLLRLLVPQSVNARVDFCRALQP
jgi:DNA-binding transcriptional regulator YdaS (Cro superfamily)